MLPKKKNVSDLIAGVPGRHCSRLGWYNCVLRVSKLRYRPSQACNVRMPIAPVCGRSAEVVSQLEMFG